MATKRGRTITSFGQFFGGLSGGSQAPAVTGTIALTLRERSTSITLHERTESVTLKKRKVDLTLSDNR